MNAKQAIKEQELAAYHFAEAERYERQAHNQRVIATKHLAACHLFFKDALNAAIRSTNQETQTQEQA
jgi:hypothetical protein